IMLGMSRSVPGDIVITQKRCHGHRAVVLLVLLATAGACHAGPGGAVPPTVASGVPLAEDGRSGVLRAFQTHSVVLLGEVHRSAEVHAFLRAMVASPDFARTVDDVVLEATNVRYQPILDRFIAGDSVPRDSLRLVWRNSTQLLLWDSPVYEELVETIRTANRKLPAGHKLRVLASDPPIDWSSVHTA